jgi:hypothetical protein
MKFFFRKKGGNLSVFWFPLYLLSEKFFILRRIKRDVIIIAPRNSSYLPAYEDGTGRVFRKVRIKNSDAG